MSDSITILPGAPVLTTITVSVPGHPVTTITVQGISGPQGPPGDPAIYKSFAVAMAIALGG